MDSIYIVDSISGEIKFTQEFLSTKIDNNSTKDLEDRFPRPVRTSRKNVRIYDGFKTNNKYIFDFSHESFL